MSFTVGQPTQRVERPRNLPGLFDSFAEPLGQGLGEGINKSISDSLKTSALQRALGMVNPESNALDQYLQLGQSGQVDPETMQLLEDQYFGKVGERDKSLALAAEKAQKGQMNPRERAHVQNVYNRMGQIVKSGNVGFHPMAKGISPLYKSFGKEYQKNAAELDTLGLQIMGLTRTLENTGHLTEFQAKQVQERIPKPDDSPEVLEGKMKGIAEILQLDPGVFGVEAQALPNPTEQASEPPKNTIIKNRKTGEEKIWNGSRWQSFKGK